MYSGTDITKAAKRQKILKRTQGECTRLQDGEKPLQVDSVLFHNARMSNKRVYGIDNVWAEKEFQDDMVRRHPEFAVKNHSRTIMVGGYGGHTPGVGRLTRHGRVTFHKVYR